MSEIRNQAQELVDEHLSRGSANDAALIKLIAGLAAIGEVLAAVQAGTAHWGPIVLRLKKALADTKAALKRTQADAGLDALRTFAERQVAFAGAVEDELVQLEEQESTLA
jgi:hypothetical protein